MDLVKSLNFKTTTTNNIIKKIIWWIPGQIFLNLLDQKPIQIKPEIFGWYTIYDLWQLLGDNREFTYFEILGWDDDVIPTHHHDQQNACVVVLLWEGDVIVWWIKSKISQWDLLFLPKWISHWIAAKKWETLKLISIQDIPILQSDWSRDFHDDSWEFLLQSNANIDDYIVKRFFNTKP